mmetsp:Transcript_1180/g.2597  ORF Transcript_1180/g.2597 Transcript_1180/m.2597 type:complete len:511 (+) Transcript_1180:55-1587(+)
MSLSSQPDQDEVKFARSLVNPEKAVRDKTLATLKKYVSSNESFDDMEMLKLWKALYYCMWLSDKQPVQMELAQRLADLGKSFANQDMTLLYMRMFFRIMLREWFYLDAHRVNKFYSLLRMMIRRALAIAAEAQWEEGVTTAILDIFSQEVLTKTPNGVRYQMSDVFLTELMNVTEGKVGTELFLTLLNPFLDCLTRRVEDKVFVQRVHDAVFVNFVTEFARETKTPEAEEEEEKEEEKEASVKKVFSDVNTKALQKKIFDTAADETTPDGRRKKLYDLHKIFAATTGAQFVSESVEELLGKKGKKKAKAPVAVAAVAVVAAVVGKDSAVKGKKRALEEATTATTPSAKSTKTAVVESKSEKKVKSAKKVKIAEPEEEVEMEVVPEVKAPKQAVGGKTPERKTPKKDAALGTSGKAAPSSSKKTESATKTPVTKTPVESAKTPVESKTPVGSAKVKTPKSKTPQAEAEAPAATTPAAPAAPAKFIGSAKFAGKKPGYIFQKVWVRYIKYSV